MKPRKIIGAVVVLVIAAGVWWFMQSAPIPAKVAVATAKPASIPEGQYPIDPKSPALHPPPSAPMVPPPALPHPPQPVDRATPTSVVNADTQADLKTALPDMVRLKRAGDGAGFYQTYTPPSKFDPAMLKAIQTNQAQVQQMFTARQQAIVQQIQEANAKSYEELELETPAFNAAGDEATYPITLYDGTGETPDVHTTVTFIKIDGKWYYKEGATGGPTMKFI